MVSLLLFNSRRRRRRAKQQTEIQSEHTVYFNKGKKSIRKLVTQESMKIRDEKSISNRGKRKKQMPTASGHWFLNWCTHQSAWWKKIFNSTSKDMPKLPFNIMKVPSNKFLSWWLLWEVLHDRYRKWNQYQHQHWVISLEQQRYRKRGYQRRKDFLSSSARNRESSMSTCITCCQCLAKIICGLLARNSQLHWNKSLLLLLLWRKKEKKTIHKPFKKPITLISFLNWTLNLFLLESEAVMSSGHKLHLFQHLPEITRMIYLLQKTYWALITTTTKNQTQPINFRRKR